MTRKRPLAAVLPSLLLVLLSLPLACSSGGGAAEESAGGPPPLPTSESPIPTESFVGNVVETTDAGTYTYVALEREGERIWAAGPRTALEIGDEITIALDMRIENFESETLGRTFETIYFVGSLGAGRPGAGPGSTGDPDDPHAGLPLVPQIDSDSIEKSDGGYRVAELWDRRGELTGKEVSVRGRVVKYNPGILGRNWLHIQDGSGDPGQGNHDLTVTTANPSGVGDLVTVRGVVAVDQDFGAGYRYDLIVEKAAVEVE